MENHRQRAITSADVPASLAEFLNNAESFSAVAIRDGCIVAANRSFAVLLGYEDPQELVGVAYASIFEPSDFSEGFDSRHCLRVDGTAFKVGFVESPWASSPDFTLVIFRDVTIRDTEHRRCIDSVEKSEERYRTLVEQAADGIFIADQSGRYIDVNESGCATFGYTWEEITQLSPMALTVPEQLPLLQEEWTKIQNGGISVVEWKMIRKNGDTFPAEVCARQLSDGRLLGMLRDVSEKKAAEQKLLQAHEQLERAFQVQREFLNNITHEVRTPLTAVIGYVNMLLERVTGSLNEEQVQLLRRVLSNSEHLLDIVTSVLEMSRLRSGNIGLRPRICSPGDIVNKALSSVLPQAEKKGLKLHFIEPEREHPGQYDEQKLTVVVTNLLSNAVKFTESGALEIMLESDKDGLCVTVVDTGLGIPEAELANIFDEFHQLDIPRKHKPNGFGIGLAIVASMVEVLGASLAVSSEKGLGTAFTLEVPAIKG